VIPPRQNGDFVAHMERVLEVYKRPYDVNFPVVCMDETLKQLIKETRQKIAAIPGHPVRYDYEYERGGVCNIFLASEPLAGKRLVKITERKTKRDWALFVKEIAQRYKNVKKITLVMDNLSTHKAGSLYETFSPEEAKALWDRFELVYTPKHGSWLNMAEIELNVLSGQCLNRRIDNISVIRRETDAWQNHRNNLNAKINWQFIISKARIKLKRLYPTYEM
jgi:transposase